MIPFLMRCIGESDIVTGVYLIQLQVSSNAISLRDGETCIDSINKYDSHYFYPRGVKLVNGFIADNSFVKV